MAEAQADANAASVGKMDVPVSSIGDGFEPDATASVGSIPTVDVVPDKGAGEAKPAGEEKPIAAEGAGKQDGEGAAATMRFDQHPDWQRMMKERDDARIEAATLKGRLEAVQPVTEVETKPEELPYKDITKIPKEQLIEWMEDDPIGYEANKFQQFLYEARQILTAEQTEAKRTATIKERYEKYSTDNPDFMVKWNSGEIQKFMEANPEYPTPIAAHKVMTEEARLQTAINKAVKEATDKVIKNFQAKANAQVIDGGPGAKTGGEDMPDELKDSTKYGGSTSALAMRLQRLRESLSGGR